MKPEIGLENRSNLQFSAPDADDFPFFELPLGDFAAGDEDLAAGDPPEDEVLAAGVQLGEDVVQQEDGPLAGVVLEKLPLGQLQGQGGRSGLALGGELPGRLAVDFGQQVVLVGTGQAGAGLHLRPGVALLVSADGLAEFHGGA